MFESTPVKVLELGTEISSATFFGRKTVHYVATGNKPLAILCGVATAAIVVVGICTSVKLGKRALADLEDGDMADGNAVADGSRQNVEP